MIWDREGLKSAAKVAFQRNYGSCVLVALLVSIVTGLNYNSVGDANSFRVSFPWGVWISFSALLILLSVFISNVLEIGGCRFFVENRDYQAPASKLLFGFQCGNYGNLVWTMFLMNLKIFLWTLLLFIPGIVKTYEYRMVPYILAEQPDLPQQDAFAISREMMMGQKFEAWVLDLSFIGWWLLAGVTCGLVGIFWTAPYVYATNAELYAALRDRWMQKQNMGNPYETQGESY